MSNDRRLILCCMFLAFFLQQAESEWSEWTEPPDMPCGAGMVSEKGILFSPNYPDRYEPNKNCYWTIIAPEGPQINLRFKWFQLEDSYDCINDYVEIFDGHNSSSPSLGKFCGNTIPDVISSSGKVMAVKFVTSSSINGEGFAAVFYTNLTAESSNIRSPESGICGGELQSENGTIHSPKYRNTYRPLQECIWKITVPEDYLVGVTFTSFDLERSFGGECKFDFVSIIDGLDAESPVLDTICGKQYSRAYQSSTNKIAVKFVSDDSFGASGFTASFRTVVKCGEQIIADRGVIQTPNNTNGSGFACAWRITVPESYTVLLKLRQYDVWELVNPEESFAAVQIRDGPSKTSPIIGNYFDFNLPSTERSTGNEMTVLVSSNYGESLFYAEFEKDRCDEDVIAESGIIISRNYPKPYYRNEDCRWKITVPKTYQVRLNFQAFEVEDQESCRYDYVEIRDGDNDNSPSLGKFCGDDLPPVIHSSFHKLSIRFVSDSTKQYQGFSVEFTKDRCGDDIVSDTGVFSSPNYPHNYPPNSACIWKITVPEGHQVTLEFRTFSLEVGYACMNDFVQVLDGHEDDSPILRKSCGQLLPQPVRSTGNKITVKFVSDNSYESNGFTAEFGKEEPSG